MRELTEITKLTQAKALLSPVRVAILAQLAEPKTCRELAALLDLTQQRVNHHLKEMLKAKLIEIAETRGKRNLVEAVYRRTSKAYWFSPDLARAMPGDGDLRETLSLHNLLVMAETLHHDAARLLGKAHVTDVPSLGFEAEVVLKDEAARQEFTRAMLRAFHGVAEAYQGVGTAESRYKVMFSVYPNPDA